MASNKCKCGKKKTSAKRKSGAKKKSVKKPKRGLGRSYGY